MSLLKTVNKIIVEGAVKRAMEDLIEKAAKNVAHSDDDDKYVMNVVAKVLQMDHTEMFAGNAVECEAMVRGTLGIPEKKNVKEDAGMYDVTDENDPKSETYFSGTKGECEEWIKNNKDNDQYRGRTFSCVKSGA